MSISRKIIVAGSRTGISQNDVSDILSNYSFQSDDIIITGGAIGVDQYAEKWAEENNLTIETFYPDYKNNGKSAPLIRNCEMAEAGDILIAIHNGESRGTQHMINSMKKLNKMVWYHEIK